MIDLVARQQIGGRQWGDGAVADVAVVALDQRAGLADDVPDPAGIREIESERTVMLPAGSFSCSLKNRRTSSTSFAGPCKLRSGFKLS